MQPPAAGRILYHFVWATRSLGGLSLALDGRRRKDSRLSTTARMGGGLKCLEAILLEDLHKIQAELVVCGECVLSVARRVLLSLSQADA